jgi:hypothetical protein
LVALLALAAIVGWAFYYGERRDPPKSDTGKRCSGS